MTAAMWRLFARERRRDLRLVLETSQRCFNALVRVARWRRHHQLNGERLVERLVASGPHLPHGARPEQADEHVLVADDLADVDFHGSLCYLTGVSSQTGRRLKTEGWATDDSNDFASGVGERIRVARQHKGWTQVELAEAAGLSSNYVARLERGELGASLFVAMRIAEALGITLDGLATAHPTPAKTTTKRRAGSLVYRLYRRIRSTTRRATSSSKRSVLCPRPCKLTCSPCGSASA